MKENHRTIGAYYEEVAARFLEENGYRILERNFHAGRTGEIDLIALEESEQILVFAEVKYRSSSACGLPWEAVDRKKQLTIRHCAGVWLAGHREIRYTQIRFDVLSILGRLSIEHFTNAF